MLKTQVRFSWDGGRVPGLQGEWNPRNRLSWREAERGLQTVAARDGDGTDCFELVSEVYLMPGLSGLQGLPFILLFFVAMYFLMFAPQQRKQKQWQAMLAQIKSGDKVTTTGGLRGTVVSVKDDVLIIRVAPDSVKLEVAKSAIAAVTTDEEVKG